MGRTGNRRYRRERAAVLRGDIVCSSCGKQLDSSSRWLVDKDGSPILDPETGKRRMNPLYPTADHITPYALGGRDSRANLRPMCFRCNSKRGKRDRPVALRRSGSVQ